MIASWLRLGNAKRDQLDGANKNECTKRIKKDNLGKQKLPDGSKGCLKASVPNDPKRTDEFGVATDDPMLGKPMITKMNTMLM